MSLKRLDHLGKKLYVQLDNTAKENKNIHVLRFFGKLVKEQKFEEIQISFLMVGHTHNDVDQLFSMISKRLFKSNTKDLRQLRDKIKQSTQRVSFLFFSFLLFSFLFFSFLFSFLFFSFFFFICCFAHFYL